MKNSRMTSIFKASVFFLVAAVSVFLAACQTSPTGEVIGPTAPAAPAIEIITPATPMPASPALAPAIRLVSYPDSGTEGDTVTIIWMLDGPDSLSTTHTAIHYGVKSFPGIFGTSVSVAQASYPDLAGDYAQMTSAIPGQFSAEVKLPTADAFYFRAHAIVDGKNYWTDEYVIDLVPPVVETAVSGPEPTIVSGETFKEYVFEADNNGIYPSTMDIRQGDYVKLTFRVRADAPEDGVMFATLLKNEWVSTPVILPGGEYSVYFPAMKSYKFGLYPAGGPLAYVADVIVVDREGNAIGGGSSSGGMGVY